MSDLAVWLTQALNLTFWVWQDLRQFTFFGYDILVSTIERNMEDWWVVGLFTRMKQHSLFIEKSAT